MLNIYKELDMIISDYIGYRECGTDIDEDTGFPFPNYDCADPVLYDKITDECSRHIDGKLRRNRLSKDALYCIENWEELLKKYTGHHLTRKV